MSGSTTWSQGQWLSRSERLKQQEGWSEWLREPLDRTEGSNAYSLTLQVNRLRRWYLKEPNTKSRRRVQVTNYHITNGLATSMSDANFHRQLIADIESWYVRTMQEWFGWKWTKLKHLQPRGVGSLDTKTLAGKSGLDASAMRRDASDSLHPCAPRVRRREP